MLYLIEILHQTTTDRTGYIKNFKLYLIEILHQTTTSSGLFFTFFSCILSKFYIKPQLRRGDYKTHAVVSYRNSTSNHNSCLCISEETAVVSYRNSTSNHNCFSGLVLLPELYLIEILHQTTTFGLIMAACALLYLIEILHQTTTSGLILIDKVLLTGCLPL